MSISDRVYTNREFFYNDLKKNGIITHFFDIDKRDTFYEKDSAKRKRFLDVLFETISLIQSLNARKEGLPKSELFNIYNQFTDIYPFIKKEIRLDDDLLDSLQLIYDMVQYVSEYINNILRESEEYSLSNHGINNFRIKDMFKSWEEFEKYLTNLFYLIKSMNHNVIKGLTILLYSRFNLKEKRFSKISIEIIFSLDRKKMNDENFEIFLQGLEEYTITYRRICSSDINDYYLDYQSRTEKLNSQKIDKQYFRKMLFIPIIDQNTLNNVDKTLDRFHDFFLNM